MSKVSFGDPNNLHFRAWRIPTPYRRQPITPARELNTPRPDINNPNPVYTFDPLEGQAAAIRDELITATHIKWRNA
jgi:hypothetical protein